MQVTFVRISWPCSWFLNYSKVISADAGRSNFVWQISNFRFTKRWQISGNTAKNEVMYGLTKQLTQKFKGRFDNRTLLKNVQNGYSKEHLSCFARFNTISTVLKTWKMQISLLHGCFSRVLNCERQGCRCKWQRWNKWHQRWLCHSKLNRRKSLILRKL